MNNYRNKENVSSSDSDDSNSPVSFKPRTLSNKSSPFEPSVMDLDMKPEPPVTENIRFPSKRKVNNIWATVAQEQSLNDDLGQFKMKKSDTIGFDRGCEEYDFTRKEIDTRPDPESDDEIDLDYGVSDIENEFEDSEQSASGRPKDKNKKKEPKVQFLEKPEDAEKIGREVANKLQEPKVELLVRSVLVLGRKKVFDLLHMTDDIQENGGMLIVNGTRKRTTGGVFLFQLRKDKEITTKQKTYIFAEDKAKSNYNVRKSQQKMLKKRELKKQRPKVVQMHIDICEPQTSAASLIDTTCDLRLRLNNSKSMDNNLDTSQPATSAFNRNDDPCDLRLRLNSSKVVENKLDKFVPERNFSNLSDSSCDLRLRLNRSKAEELNLDLYKTDSSGFKEIACEPSAEVVVDSTADISEDVELEDGEIL